MKATTFRWQMPGMPGSGEGKSSFPKRAVEGSAASARRLTLMERLDRWLWGQEVREREAYLAQSKDIHELEDRIRHLERSDAGRFC
jgi:hypothetical protein